MKKILCYRQLTCAAAVALAIALAPLAAVHVAAQNPGTTATAGPATKFVPPKSSYVPPKTPWGDPDIQGIYDYQSMIPMQRPVELAGKKTFTDRELAEWAKLRTPNQDQCGYGTKATQTCTVQQLDNVGGYNEFWDNRNIVHDNRTSLIEDPDDGRIPAMTSEGTARQLEWRKTHVPNAGNETAGGVVVRHWDDFPTVTRCIAEQTPNGVQMYNSGTYLMQTPGWVLIVRERLDTRQIPLDNRPHISPRIQNWQGDSRGHWEGNTLVVETTNFTDKQAAAGVGSTIPAGIPMGNIRVTEYFVPISRERIHYYATVEDPKTWVRPWSFMLPWQRDDNYTIYEYACNEGNISVGNALKGTAYLDSAVASVPADQATSSLLGSNEAAIRARFGEPLVVLGPRWEYERTDGNPFYVYFTGGKVASVRPNDIALTEVKKR